MLCSCSSSLCLFCAPTGSKLSELQHCASLTSSLCRRQWNAHAAINVKFMAAVLAAASNEDNVGSDIPIFAMAFKTSLHGSYGLIYSIVIQGCRYCTDQWPDRCISIQQPRAMYKATSTLKAPSEASEKGPDVAPRQITLQPCHLASEGEGHLMSSSTLQLITDASSVATGPNLVSPTMMLFKDAVLRFSSRFCTAQAIASLALVIPRSGCVERKA